MRDGGFHERETHLYWCDDDDDGERSESCGFSVNVRF